MIKITETLSWLTQFEPSHLRRTTAALVKHITNLQTPEDKRKQMITSAIQHSRNHVDRMELPELLLYITEIKFHQKKYSAARDYASASVQLFPDNSLGKVAARWILGMIAWRLPDNKLAYSSWYYAREILQNLSNQAAAQSHPDILNWYQDILQKMNVDMVCTAEEVYTWLDYFEASHLSNAAQQLNNTIISKLEGNQFQDVYMIIQDMQTLGRSSADVLENAEILVECGLAIYRMGNLNEATLLIQKAIDSFTPKSHHQAVARWLLGVLQWELPERNNQAIMNWEKCMENFLDLARKADQENKQNYFDWYRQKNAIMTTALSEKIREKLG